MFQLQTSKVMSNFKQVSGVIFLTKSTWWTLLKTLLYGYSTVKDTKHFVGYDLRSSFAATDGRVHLVQKCEFNLTIP